MRLTMNAFCAAPAAERRVNQNPISRYDARPTPPRRRGEEVVGQDQHQHRERQRRKVGEEAGKTRVALHVSLGIDVDQKSDAGDHDQHHRGQLIDEEIDPDVEAAGLNPGVESCRSGSPVALICRNTSSERRNEAKTAGVAIQCAAVRRNRPKRRLMAKARSGSSGMR